VDPHDALNIPVGRPGTPALLGDHAGNISVAGLVCLRGDANIDTRSKRHMSLIGRLHPMLVHFPIALILAGTTAEILAIRTGRASWRALAVANVRAGGAMGALTAVAGWALPSSPFLEPSALLTWHLWTGLAGATAAIGAALASTRSRVDSRRSAFVCQAALLGAAALVAIAGHLGETVVWGTDFPH
jgi:uncharacterized membrane protein